MPEHLKFILRTLRDPGPPVEIRCSCDDFWSVAQQHAMLQLYARIVQHQPGRIDLSRHCPRVIPPDPLPDPGWPAPRHKDPKGRWTDIEPQLRAEYHGVVVRYSSRAQRIAGAYARVFLEDFEHGKPERLGRFYWAGLAAFASKQVAFTIQNKLLLFYAMRHLWAMARHEQGEVLQGLIYGNPRFRKEIELGRLTGMPPLSYMPFICFRMQLSFSASEYVDDPDWRSDAPPGIRIDNYHERMDWIRDTAGQYHKLMSGPCRRRLLAELRTLADHDD